ncbi:uncharacterized protein LOC109841199 [Asparagus officinalis]|uniref:uncharacterized protein LOC109841199 n=1 Tax=Asparagus officinalis TaxID=4686 RepID=UPI00098E5BCE|nr:uncharacterized protein LOC109841199 [Asparagus officinalis]
MKPTVCIMLAVVICMLDWCQNWVPNIDLSWNEIGRVLKAGKESLIAQTEKDMSKALEEMKSTLTDQVFMEFDIHDVIKTVAEGIEKNKIPHTEVVRILWDALMDTIVYRDVRVRPELLECYVSTKVFLQSELLRAFCITEECELELLKQVHRRSIKEQRLHN